MRTTAIKHCTLFDTFRERSWYNYLLRINKSIQNITVRGKIAYQMCQGFRVNDSDVLCVMSPNGKNNIYTWHEVSTYIIRG